MIRRYYNNMLAMLEQKHVKKFRNDIFCYNQKLLYHGAVRWLRFLFFAEVLHLKELNERLDKPLIIVGNHVSAWDPFLAFSALNRSFFKKHIAWRIPVFHEIFHRKHNKFFFKFIGAYPIRPEGRLDKSLAKTMQIIDQGHNSIYFPEGKRILEGENSKPKKGIGYIVKHRDVYILPFYIEYSRRGKDGFGTRIGARARIVFGGIYDSQYFRSRYDEDRLHYGVMDSVQGLKGAFRKEQARNEKQYSKALA